MINIRFYTDPVTELPHIYNHNVIEVEVEEILLNPGEDWQERKTHVMHSANTGWTLSTGCLCSRSHPK